MALIIAFIYISRWMYVVLLRRLLMKRCFLLCLGFFKCSLAPAVYSRTSICTEWLISVPSLCLHNDFLVFRFYSYWQIHTYTSPKNCRILGCLCCSTHGYFMSCLYRKIIGRFKITGFRALYINCIKSNSLYVSLKTQRLKHRIVWMLVRGGEKNVLIYF